MELLYKTTELANSPESLKLDVDTAFDQPRVLSSLGTLRSERLLEKVAGIDNGLELRRETFAKSEGSGQSKRSTSDRCIPRAADTDRCGKQRTLETQR